MTITRTSTKALLVGGLVWLSSLNPLLAQQDAPLPFLNVQTNSQQHPSSPTGPIDETIARCNMEELEQANDSQLYTILHDLKQTTFFRNFRVDLSHICPLRSWRLDHDKDHDSDDDDEQEEDEFDCPSANSLELDDDAEPLCTVEADDSAFGSSALFSLSQDGFQSKEQRETYTWKQHVDQVVTPQTSSLSQLDDGADCVDDPQANTGGHLPQDFWVDLCTRVRNDDPSIVNLSLNPERNTGYNGTHIWHAIYEENCRAVSPEADSDACLEERVLYRLLSGLHTSTTLSIAKNFYPPSKRKGRADWEPNPHFFMEKFSEHPEHVRNLHFSYVVLLRALTKASGFLHQYKIQTGDVMEDETATVLLRRLLDSSILQSCSSVFSAFDESLMFASVDELNQDFSLQHSFKDVFFNISSILDCVQCQQCKLHGKMSMLGYGTALKILFSPANVDLTDILSRNEIVALINTLAKFSESIRHVRELTQLYLESEQQQQATIAPPSSAPVESTFPTASNEATESAILSVSVVDLAVGAIASLARHGWIDANREVELIQLALARHPELLVLARHYSSVDPAKFLQLSQFIQKGDVGPSDEGKPDAIVIGSGLAGMAAALNILDRGGKVILLEKEHLLGGNSGKASSGINACCPADYDPKRDGTDSVDIFRNDTTRSAGTLARPDLIDVLVRNSADAVTWLRDRVGVDLSLKAQLGGHSAKRTHRPSNGMAGAEIIYGMQKAVKAYKASGKVTILTDSKVTQLIEKDGRVVGVEYVDLLDQSNSPSTEKIYSDNVILATGGFAADRSEGSYLSKYRPELLGMPTTAGAFSTGDGITLAGSLEAGRVDMDKVQIHPTGYVDPKDPDNKSKVLAAELMRGVGGILINDKGERFCNELGTRAYVTDKMLSHDAEYEKSKEWDIKATVPTFSLVLSSSAALDGKKHVDLYSHKGLLTKLEGVTALAEWMQQPKSKLMETLRKYKQSGEQGSDEFGKTSFRGLPQDDLESEVFYAGTVTPVLHYCMGGISIDTEGNVLNKAGQIIPGLHAAGEVTGGVHGANRLGGNSLLECTVYGTLVGQKIPIQARSQQTSQTAQSTDLNTPSPQLKTVTPSELALHNTPEDCWVAIHGIVYDLTSFAEEHPAGPESIHVLAGKDGSEAFDAVHNKNILEEVFEDVVGKLVEEDVNASLPSGVTSDAKEGEEEADEPCGACGIAQEQKSSGSPSFFLW